MAIEPSNILVTLNGKAYYKRYYKRGYYGKNGSPYAQAEGMPMDIPHVEL